MYTFDVSELTHQIAVPHSPDSVVPLTQVAGQTGRHGIHRVLHQQSPEDLHAAAAVLRGRHVAPDVRMIVTAASRKIFNEELRDGTIATLSEAGASFITSGCGRVGTHQGVPGDDEVVISSTNRNFRAAYGQSQRTHLSRVAGGRGGNSGGRQNHRSGRFTGC